MKKQWIFKSIFADEIIAYLNLRMSIGHRINNDRFVLHNLDSYLQTIELKEKHLPYSIIEEWFSTLAANTGANTAIVRISHYTQFANYLSSLGYHAFIPEKPGADHSYVPYIFSQRELDEIVKAADYIIEQMKEDLVKETGCKLEDIKVIATGGLNSMLSPITDAFNR